MNEVYALLEANGITEGAARNFILPQWWPEDDRKDHEFAQAAIQQAQMIISKRLGLDFLAFTQGVMERSEFQREL